jgi:hypothetical protein
MELIIATAIWIITGILISKLARLVGSKIFKISDIYKLFLKLLKKSRI